MTNQQAPEIYTLHTVPNKGERPWSGIYTVRADAEHDAKVMRDVTGRDWSVVRLVVADTNDRVPEELFYADALDRCAGIDFDHIFVPAAAVIRRLYAENERLAALVEAQQPAPSTAADLIAALEEARSAINNMKVEAETAAQGDEQMMLEACETISNEGLQADMAIRAALASAPKPSSTSQANNQPALPEITAGDRLFLHYNPNTDDIVDWIQRYANTAITADRASRVQADSVRAASGANWQDISTAPKDGTRFVAVGNNYGLDSETQHTCIAQWFRGCWMEVSEWNEDSELKYLTHWMPLPPLPGSAARKQGANHD